MAQALRMAAMSAGGSQTFIGARHRARPARKDAPVAVTATARGPACLVHTMVTRGEEHLERGMEEYGRRRVNRTFANLDRRARQLGYQLVSFPESPESGNAVESMAWGCFTQERESEKREEAGNAGNGGDQRRHDPPHGRHDCDQPKNAEDAQRPQDGQRTARRQESDKDDHEVKDIPSVPEEPPAESEQLGRQFDDEDRQYGPVDEQQNRADPRCHIFGGLKAKRNRIENDQGRDRAQGAGLSTIEPTRCLARMTTEAAEATAIPLSAQTAPPGCLRCLTGGMTGGTGVHAIAAAESPRPGRGAASGHPELPFTGQRCWWRRTRGLPSVPRRHAPRRFRRYGQPAQHRVSDDSRNQGSRKHTEPLSSLQFHIREGQCPDKQAHGKPDAGEGRDTVDMQPAHAFRQFAQSQLHGGPSHAEHAQLLADDQP